MASAEPRALELLSRPILGQLGFIGLDGYPHVLAVWFAFRDGEVLVASRPGEYKCRSLRADGRAALTVSTPEWPYLMVTAVGDALVEPGFDGRPLEGRQVVEVCEVLGFHAV